MTAMAIATQPRPSLRRDPAHGIAAGVCAGIARRLGAPVVALRLAFIVAAVAGGVGVVAYGLAWLAIPADSARSARSRRAGIEVAVGAGLLMLALLLSMRELGLWISDAVIWPVMLAGAGGALLWRTPRRPAEAREPAPQTLAPTAAVPAAAGAEGVAPPPRAEVAAGVYRGGFGVALVVGAGLLFLQSAGALGPLRDVVLGAVVIVVSSALILAPFLWRLGRNLAQERSERIRSQERAELAAHLHDSVLQTLALVQKRADDPRAVATIARRQERELRAWLWDPGAPAADASLAAALRAAGAEVEDAHGVPVEVVTVGDAPLDERAAALVAAAREALTNAAKFAGDAGPVALYAEADADGLAVFVRDRGAGFEPAAVPADRRGVRDSILGRMERHGGWADVHPAPGGGTEVELHLEPA
jgi:signal transduction histidine kinase/phage shock protein PspC (stress-responsive transcriptional regulator)